MSIVALGFDYYEITAFSGEWKYGHYYHRNDEDKNYDLRGNYYEEYTVNNIVTFVLIAGIARAVLTVITAILIIIQTIQVQKMEKSGELVKPK